MVTNLFAVEDKLKDQLEAANPEPIIEEVVSSCSSAVVQSGLYSSVQQQLLPNNSKSEAPSCSVTHEVCMHCLNVNVL